MVFVKDQKKDFYEVIQHQRVLVMVAFDVDSLCACKILQYLFQCDQVLYTLVPISGKQDLETAYLENSEGVKYVIMINCGANIDLIEVLQPEENVVFYIADSHRPVDISNIYNSVQVKLLIDQKDDDFEDVPEYDQCFRDDSEDEDDCGNESDSEPMGKRQRFDADVLERRRERRLWHENRVQILFNYRKFSKFGKSAALSMFELAWKMSKDTNDLLWLAIVGMTDQFVHRKVDRDHYIDMVSTLQSHVSRHNHRGDDEDNTVSVDCLKITFETELQLTLYRHWSLFESICHSLITACKFKVWTLKGRKRLHEFLADVGLPLVQCRQKFVSMDAQIKNNVKTIIEDKLDKYGLMSQEVFVPSFHAQYGYKNKYCATDVVHACSAVLENIDKEKTPSDNFLDALDILTRTNIKCLEVGIDSAKKQLMAMMKQVQSFLDMNQVLSAGPFLYTFIQEGIPDARFFSHSICLQRLARMTLEAFSTMSRNKKAKSLPLVVGVPLDMDNGTMLVTGVPPTSENTAKNFFGKAFEQAAESTHSRILQDSFDEPIIEMKVENKNKFFDALINILQT